MNKIGVCYHPKLPDDLGKRVAEDLAAVAGEHVGETWVAPAWDEDATRANMPGTDLLLCVGGDGTVLRAARMVVEHDVLLLGVNMGRLGFLTELDVDAAKAQLPDIVSGAGRIEPRAMLHAELVHDGDDEPARHDALNDVVIGRATLGRTIQVSVSVDGSPLADVRADGVIIATATGSTAYSLSAGGPILPPESDELVITLLAPHLASHNSVVLPSASIIEVRLAVGEATFSVDGERDLDLRTGQIVRVSLSPRRVRFLRTGAPTQFYGRLSRRLNWLGEPGGASE